MNKKILVISSSSRRMGNTDLLCDEFIRGAKENGNETEKIYLKDKNIYGCMGCGACQKNGGECVRKDDMQEIYHKMLESEIIAFASPVYFYTFNSQIKALMDRTYAIENKMKDKTLYLISAGAAPEKSYMKTILDTFEKYISCFENIKNGGNVIAYGVSDIGDVKENPALKEAYELGSSL